ncbi:MAG: hypothetical protein RML45_14250 [Acetobacteraceae bacterium]|nr:hypothetical protein [Acetobacteraceae bacterium]
MATPISFRHRFGLAKDRPLLAVMPGSRAGELARHLPIFTRACALLLSRRPDLALFVPTLPALEAMVRAAPWPAPPIVATDAQTKHDGWAAAVAALAKSGTTSLELAVAGLPHVIAYRANPLTAAIVRRLVRVRHASLVNLLAGRRGGAGAPAGGLHRARPGRRPVAAARGQASAGGATGRIRPSDRRPPRAGRSEPICGGR